MPSSVIVIPHHPSALLVRVVELRFIRRGVTTPPKGTPRARSGCSPTRSWVAGPGSAGRMLVDVNRVVVALVERKLAHAGNAPASARNRPESRTA